MARIPRRTHSVSGPPSVHCLMKDVSCCCNVMKIHQFYMSMMALRRNPQRKCKKEEAPGNPTNVSDGTVVETKMERTEPTISSRINQRSIVTRHPRQINPGEPFRFFDLPREVRDHVYSYLVVRRGRKVPIFESKAILRRQKKRATAEKTRERLNQKRLQTGRRPIAPREPTTEPIIHLNVLKASRQLHHEASDHLYQNNWFAISLDNFPITTIETPFGWDRTRITKMQLELQLKDAQRMNSYIDWVTFFASFPSLRSLRIVPTFHPRYYDWAHTELATWESAHYIFRAFFRELLASIPEMIRLRLGPSFDPEENMHLDGHSHVSRRLLQCMYTELGTRRDVNGRYLAVNKVVECRGMPCD